MKVKDLQQILDGYNENAEVALYVKQKENEYLFDEDFDIRPDTFEDGKNVVVLVPFVERYEAYEMKMDEIAGR